MDAFDLDPDVVSLARKRISDRDHRVHLWTGDAQAIKAKNNTYDAVFDFGIIHHVQAWRKAIREVYRVLRPGGKFYVEEVLKKLILNPIARRLFKHPLSSFISACVGDRLNTQEIIGLSHAMIQVGEKIHWNHPIIVDKHCVGGLPGNRTTPIVVAIVTAGVVLHAPGTAIPGM